MNAFGYNINTLFVDLEIPFKITELEFIFLTIFTHFTHFTLTVKSEKMHLDLVPVKLHQLTLTV